jgi:prepilin-type N-terminal cleavage/methylation domain-containing protein
MAPVVKHGFTLIELLVVITIISLLLVVLMPSYSSLGAKTRLNNSADTLTQMIEQARTFSVSGYKVLQDDLHPVAVGVHLVQGGDTYTMFTCPLTSDEQIPCDLNAIQEIKSEKTDDIVIRSLQDSNQPQISFPSTRIIFVPPFGNATIVIPPQQIVTSLKIVVGLGLLDNNMKKDLEFTTATNRINYDS